MTSWKTRPVGSGVWLPDVRSGCATPYIVQCVDVIRDSQSNEIVEVHCTYDPETQGGAAPKGRKVHGTIHWVSAQHALPAEIRLYDRLFSDPNPDDVEVGKTFKDYLNPDSLSVLSSCRVEPSVSDDPPGTRYQFERQGYFVSDAVDSGPGALIYNRIIELRDSWAKSSAKRPNVRPTVGADLTEPSAKNGKPNGEGDNRRSRTGIREEIRANTPELADRFRRYNDELALPVEDADVLSGDLALSDFFEAALSAHNSPQTVAKWVTNEVLRELKDRPIDSLPFSGERLGVLVALVDQGAISATIGKEVFAEMVATGEDPKAIVSNRGLKQVADPAVLEADCRHGHCRQCREGGAVSRRQDRFVRILHRPSNEGDRGEGGSIACPEPCQSEAHLVDNPECHQRRRQFSILALFDRGSGGCLYLGEGSWNKDGARNADLCRVRWCGRQR